MQWITIHGKLKCNSCYQSCSDNRKWMRIFLNWRIWANMTYMLPCRIIVAMNNWFLKRKNLTIIVNFRQEFLGTSRCRFRKLYSLVVLTSDDRRQRENAEQELHQVHVSTMSARIDLVKSCNRQSLFYLSRLEKMSVGCRLLLVSVCDRVIQSENLKYLTFWTLFRHSPLEFVA